MLEKSFELILDIHDSQRFADMTRGCREERATDSLSALVAAYRKKRHVAVRGKHDDVSAIVAEDLVRLARAAQRRERVLPGGLHVKAGLNSVGHDCVVPRHGAAVPYIRPALQSPRLDEAELAIQRCRAFIRLDHFEDVALCRKDLDRSLHQLPSDSAPSMRDHHARSAVVRLVTIEAIEYKSDQPLTVKCTDGKIWPVAATRHEVR